MINIYNMDCMTALRDMPDKEYDLAIVDPPYGIGVNHSMGRRHGDKASDFAPCTWDKEAPSEAYFRELFRVSKNQIIWGANHFIERMPISSSCWIVWDKMFSEDVSFASFEMAWTSFKKPAKRIVMSSQQPGRIHPTQKPVALYKWLLTNYAKKGDKILDTHLGSGSIAIACHDLGFDLDGYEIDTDYFNGARERLNNHMKQPRIDEVFQTSSEQLSMEGNK